MRLLLLMGILSLTLLASCKKQSVKDKEVEQGFFNDNDVQIQQYITKNNLTGFIATGTGVFYKITTSKPTAQIAGNGDSVKIHFEARLLDGSLVDSTLQTQTLNKPDLELINTNSILPGVEDALRLMREGEEATVMIPSYRGISGNSTNLIPPYSVLIYTIKLQEVKSEVEQIEEHVVKNRYTVNKDLSGTKYIVIKAGSVNTKPVENEEIFLSYTGKLLNGTIFDQNIDTTFSTFFRLTNSGLIAGFANAVAEMNAGETAQIIVPSSQAYGNSTNGAIPPYAPITFELKRIKSEKLILKENFVAKGITGDTVQTSTGLYYRITRVGTGTQATGASKVKFKYRGKKLDNAFFMQEVTSEITLSDASFKLFPFATAGVREAIKTMKVGEKRELWMPSKLGFGVSGYVGVNGRTPIAYEVELLEVL